MRVVLAISLVLIASTSLAGDLDRSPLEAATVDGEKVRLFPNGRWEFVDQAKAAKARELAADFVEGLRGGEERRRGWLDELGQFEKFHKGIVDTFVAHGGTLSHHHGVGRLVAHSLDRQHSPATLEAWRAVKKTLDPKGIMNPGALIF